MNISDDGQYDEEENKLEDEEIEKREELKEEVM
jgi:hypothetical protein